MRLPRVQAMDVADPLPFDENIPVPSLPVLPAGPLEYADEYDDDCGLLQ